MEIKLNKKTDCWRCGCTFGQKRPLATVFGHTIYGTEVYAYDEGDILCTQCVDEEMMLIHEKELKKEADKNADNTV